MIITKLHINGFGKFHNYEITAGEGLNILTGLNEAGKTTLHLFIRSMLYGVSTRRRAGRKSVEERMRPWNQPEVFGGSMDIEDEGHAYRIERDFSKSPTDLKMFALGPETAEGTRAVLHQLEAPQPVLDSLLHNVSETAYNNTVSTGQLSSAAEKDMAGELCRYAANMNSTASPDLNADRALALLAEEKEKLNAALRPDAVREYNTLLTQIRELENGLADPSRENNIAGLLAANADTRKSADSTTVKIAENELLIGTLTQEMKKSGFEKSSEIDRAEAKAHALFRDFTEKKKAVPVYRTVGIVSLAVGIFGIVSIFSDFTGLYELLSAYSRMAAVLSVILTAFGIIVLMYAGKMNSEKKKAEKLLKGMFEKHLGNKEEPLVKFGDGFEGLKEENKAASDEISEERMQELYARFNDCRLTGNVMDTARSQRESMVAELKQLNDVQGKNLNELQKQNVIRSGVEADLEQLRNLKKRAAALEREIEENKKLRNDIESVEMAEDTLAQLSEEIKDAVGTYINREAAGMLKGITGGAYDSVNAGTSYEVAVNSADGMISVGDLSQGTADQVYMALRLSAIRFITGESDALPLILDDSFALYDDERLLKAVSFLTENYRGQMLVFTCQQREEELLTGAEIAHRSIQI